MLCATVGKNKPLLLFRIFSLSFCFVFRVYCSYFYKVKICCDTEVLFDHLCKKCIRSYVTENIITKHHIHSVNLLVCSICNKNLTFFITNCEFESIDTAVCILTEDILTEYDSDETTISENGQFW